MGRKLPAVDLVILVLSMYIDGTGKGFFDATSCPLSFAPVTLYTVSRFIVQIHG